MLKALTITAMLATPVAAETLSGNPRLEACVTTSDLAESVMTYRQQPGATVTEGLRRLQSASDNPRIMALLNVILMAAFEQPFYQTESIKQSVIADFANEVFRICMANLGRDGDMM